MRTEKSIQNLETPELLVDGHFEFQQNNFFQLLQSIVPAFAVHNRIA